MKITNKEQIVKRYEDYILNLIKQKEERYNLEKYEPSLFELSHLIRCLISKDYNIDGDKNRILVNESINRAIPEKHYIINPITLDNPNLTYENL